MLAGWLAAPAWGQSGPWRELNRGREGETIAVREYLTRGKPNVVIFWSRSCPACQALEPYWNRLAASRPDLSWNRLSVDRRSAEGIDWGSPLVRQYQLRSLPAVQFYDASGQLQSEGPEARRQLSRLLVEAGLI